MKTLRELSTAAPAGALLLCAAVFAVFAPVLRHGFTIDDGYVYSQNFFIRNPANVRHLFTPDYFRFSNEASYRPVCTLTYFADWLVWKGNPAGTHAGQLALYAAVVVLVYALARRLAGSERGAFAAALLFGLHPVHSEVVSNIGFREDLLVPLFLLSAWLLYDSGRRSGGAVRPAAALGCYALGLFSKESAIVFPALWAAAEWASGRGSPRRFKERPAVMFAAGMALVTALFIAVRFRWMQFPGEGSQPRLGGGLGGTLIGAVRIQGLYLLQMLLPLRLSPMYPPRLFAPAVDAVFAASLTALAAIGIAGLAAIRRAPVAAAALLWWAAAMAPVSNLYPLYNPMADRYLFLPGIGMALAAAAWFGRLRGRVVLRAAAAATIAAAALLAARTAAYLPVWRSNLAVWTSVVAEMPDNPTALANLAHALYERGDHVRAAATGERALAAAPPGGWAFNPVPLRLTMGSAKFMMRDLDGAFMEFREAEAGLPCRFDIDFAVYRNLGLVLDEKGDLAGALAYYGKAAALDPFRAELWRKLSFCRLRLGDEPGARADWLKAVALDPDTPSFDEIVKMYRGSVPGAGERD